MYLAYLVLSPDGTLQPFRGEPDPEDFQTGSRIFTTTDNTSIRTITEWIASNYEHPGFKEITGRKTINKVFVETPITRKMLKDLRKYKAEKRIHPFNDIIIISADFYRKLLDEYHSVSLDTNVEPICIDDMTLEVSDKLNVDWTWCPRSIAGIFQNK